MSKKLPNILNALGRFKSVENCTSSSFKEVPNQFILKFEYGTVFQSYSSIIGIKFDYYEELDELLRNETFLSVKWDYSATTIKYLINTLFHPYHTSKSDIIKKIKNKEVILVDSLEFE